MATQLKRKKLEMFGVRSHHRLSCQLLLVALAVCGCSTGMLPPAKPMSPASKPVSESSKSPIMKQKIPGGAKEKTHPSDGKVLLSPPVFGSVVIGSQAQQSCSPPLPESAGVVVTAPQRLLLTQRVRAVLPVCIAWMLPPRARDGARPPALLAQNLETGVRLTATLLPEVEDEAGDPVVPPPQEAEDGEAGLEPLDAGWIAVDAIARIPSMAAPGTWRLTVTFGPVTSAPVTVKVEPR